MTDFEIYTDGSYTPHVPDKSGWGWVCVRGGKIINSAYGYVKNPKARNIDGECASVVNALTWFANSDYGKAITLYTDYIGVAKWVTGEWKTKQELTKTYRAQVLALNLDITWVHVKAHSGNIFNDMADKFAKRGVQGFSENPSIAIAPTIPAPISAPVVATSVVDPKPLNAKSPYQIAKATMNAEQIVNVLTEEEKSGQYRKLPNNIRDVVRDYHNKHITSPPSWIVGIPSVVIGDHGLFYELTIDNIPSKYVSNGKIDDQYIPANQKFRRTNPLTKYEWYEIEGTKVYLQTRTVSYADYIVGKYYVA